MNNCIEKFLAIQQHVRLYHWMTPVYNQHIVSGELYKALDDLFDTFVETYLGKYDKKPFAFEPFTTVTTSVEKDKLVRHLKHFKQFLLTDMEIFLNSDKMTNSDLKNIRDEILGKVNHFLFLLRLQ